MLLDKVDLMLKREKVSCKAFYWDFSAIWWLQLGPDRFIGRPILSADYSHQKTIGNRPKVGRLTPMFTVIFSLLKCWECVVFAVSLQRYLFKKLYFFCLFYFYLGQINKKPFCTSYFCSNCMLLVTIFIIKTFCNGKMFCLQFIYW